MSNIKNIPSKKISGKHTTLISVSEVITKHLLKHDFIKKISPGIITSYRGKNGGRHHIKIDNSDDSILLKITDGSANQKLRVYTEAKQKVELLLITIAKEKGFTISFKD